MKKLFDTYKQHYKALLLLGLPIVVGQLGVIVLGFADTLMIGHHSTEELGAASFVNNLFTLCIIFSTGFSYGLTPVVGGFYGNRRFAEAGQALRCSLVAIYSFLSWLFSISMWSGWDSPENCCL